MNTPKPLYSAAGDGYFEALIMENLRIVQQKDLHKYLDWVDVDSSVDSSDPQNVIVSASIQLNKHILLKMQSHLYLGDQQMAKSGRWFQNIVPYTMEQ
jgi:hypothetical protein